MFEIYVALDGRDSAPARPSLIEDTEKMSELPMDRPVLIEGDDIDEIAEQFRG